MNYVNTGITRTNVCALLAKKKKVVKKLKKKEWYKDSGSIKIIISYKTNCTGITKYMNFVNAVITVCHLCKFTSEKKIKSLFLIFYILQIYAMIISFFVQALLLSNSVQDNLCFAWIYCSRFSTFRQLNCLKSISPLYKHSNANTFLMDSLINTSEIYSNLEGIINKRNVLIWNWNRKLSY